MWRTILVVSSTRSNSNAEPVLILTLAAQRKKPHREHAGRKLRLDDRREQGREPIPCDLDADAEQDEGDHAQDSMRRGGRDLLGDYGCVGVAEITKHAENHDGEKHSEVRKNVVSEVSI